MLEGFLSIPTTLPYGEEQCMFEAKHMLCCRSYFALHVCCCRTWLQSVTREQTNLCLGPAVFVLVCQITLHVLQQDLAEVSGIMFAFCCSNQRACGESFVVPLTFLYPVWKHGWEQCKLAMSVHSLTQPYKPWNVMQVSMSGMFTYWAKGVAC